MKLLYLILILAIFAESTLQTWGRKRRGCCKVRRRIKRRCGRGRRRRNRRRPRCNYRNFGGNGGHGGDGGNGGVFGNGGHGGDGGNAGGNHYRKRCDW